MKMLNVAAVALMAVGGTVGALSAGGFESEVVAAGLEKTDISLARTVEVPVSGAVLARPAEDTRAAAGQLKEGLYTNGKGCVAKVSGTQWGYLVDVTGENGQHLQVGVERGYRNGYFPPYCTIPRVELNSGDELSMSCYPHYSQPWMDEHLNARGLVGLKMSGGLSDVFVRGEVKRNGQWEIETDIRCGGLKPAAEKHSPVVSSGEFVRATVRNWSPGRP